MLSSLFKCWIIVHWPIRAKVFFLAPSLCLGNTSVWSQILLREQHPAFEACSSSSGSQWKLILLQMDSLFKSLYAFYVGLAGRCRSFITSLAYSSSFFACSSLPPFLGLVLVLIFGFISCHDLISFFGNV